MQKILFDRLTKLAVSLPLSKGGAKNKQAASGGDTGERQRGRLKRLGDRDKRLRPAGAAAPRRGRAGERAMGRS